MKKRPGCLAIMLLTPLLIYGVYKLIYPTYSWREKLTVVVSTPQGERTGSAVGEMTVTYVPQLLPQIGPRESSFTGEATVVEVSDGKYLFALLNGNVGRGVRAYYTAFPEWKSDVNRAIKNMDDLEDEEPVQLPSGQRPMLVTFDDITKPETVKRVDPDDLAATFGAGYALEVVTLEITDEAVTQGRVQDVFGWVIEKKTRLAIIGNRYIEPSEFIDWQTLNVKRENTD